MVIQTSQPYFDLTLIHDLTTYQLSAQGSGHGFYHTLTDNKTFHVYQSPLLKQALVLIVSPILASGSLA